MEISDWLTWTTRQSRDLREICPFCEEKLKTLTIEGSIISKALAYLNIKTEREILFKKEWETAAKELLSDKDVMLFYERLI